MIPALMLTLLTLVASAEDTHRFVFELRLPKTVKADPLTRVELTTEAGSSAKQLRATKQRVEGEFQVFQHSFLLSDDRRRALIADPGGQPSQVFVLSIPREPKPTDWSEWRRPDYVAKGDAGWDFMHDQKKQDRSTNAPPDCFQLRYKIAKSEAP